MSRAALSFPTPASQWNSCDKSNRLTSSLNLSSEMSLIKHEFQAEQSNCSLDVVKWCYTHLFLQKCWKSETKHILLYRTAERSFYTQIALGLGISNTGRCKRTHSTHSSISWLNFNLQGPKKDSPTPSPPKKLRKSSTDSSNCSSWTKVCTRQKQFIALNTPSTKQSTAWLHQQIKKICSLKLKG